jgi:hypothetical protein
VNEIVETGMDFIYRIGNSKSLDIIHHLKTSNYPKLMETNFLAIGQILIIYFPKDLKKS